MQKRRIAIVIAVSMVLYIAFKYFYGGLTTDASLLGKLIIVGGAVSGLVEATIASWIVLTSADNALGDLKDYRSGVTIGLVAGLIFAALTCLNEFGFNVFEKSKVQSEQSSKEMSDAQPVAPGDAPKAARP